MRSAINTIYGVHRFNNRDQQGRAAILLQIQSAWHAVIVPVTRCDWPRQPLLFVRQYIALRRLKQRLALVQLAAPFFRYFSTHEIDEIGRALDVLDLTGGDGAANVWQQLCKPFITGECAGIDAVEILIRDGILKPTWCGPAGDTLLHAVARRAIVVAPRAQAGPLQDLPIEARIHRLVSLGVDADQPNAFGDIPLQLAWERTSELGNRAARALLEAGCNPMKRDRFGTTLLHRAARSNNIAVVRSWCAAGLQTCPTGGLHEGRALLQTPLMFAVMAGHRRCVEVLIDKERRAIALGEARIVCGQRMVAKGRLHSVGAGPHPAAGERLIAQGRELVAGARATLDFADSWGATALHWAIDYARPDLAELLLACGADRGKRAGRSPDCSWTSTQLAAARAQLKTTRPILALLLKHGVDPDQPLRAVNQLGCWFAG